jgi:hypothetical protein
METRGNTPTEGGQEGHTSNALPAAPAYRSQLGGIDAAAIMKAYRSQLGGIDAAAIMKAYRSQLGGIDAAAIMKAYQASMATFLASPTGERTLAAAATAVVQGGELADEPAPILQPSTEQIDALTAAMAELPALEDAPAVEPDGDLEWLLSAMITTDDPDSDDAESRVQRAIITLAIVAALTAVIVSSPTLIAAFDVLSIPATLWPFIARLVSESHLPKSDGEA